MSSICKGMLVIEYTGELISNTRMHMCKNKTYSLNVCTDIHNCVINSSIYSNKARYINHSCYPNCEFVSFIKNDLLAIGVVACCKGW